MRICCVSDLHMERGVSAQERADLVASQEADVLLIGGDLADEREAFEEGLKRLSAFRGKKLFFLGNNDLELLEDNKLTEDHEEELKGLLDVYDFHLLDHAPLVLEDVGFVGNCGWFDGSLYVPLEGHPSRFDAPNDMEMARRRATYYFQERLFPTLLPASFTPFDFFEYTYERLQAHLQECTEHPDVEKIVLGIHHVPSRDFLRVGTDPWRNYLDFCMGSSRYQSLIAHPKVVLSVVGHTHRPARFDIEETPVYNVSSTREIPFRIFDI
ncbi:MAG TPA: hypothetical protein DCE42_30845 [Myxococcales bacterium]|nr:hypothetical protein [Deltaproteobacteria bacterium]HAA59186.1 hypothetical protein [Myxococcales bacterium]